MNCTPDGIAELFGFGEKPGADRSKWATVKSVNSDGSAQVSLNGSEATARAPTLCSCSAGDRVLVLIRACGEVVVLGKK